MNNVKKSLACLCNHLNLLFDLDFCTEDFRLAKLNKSEGNIAFKFWKLLSVLTLKDETVDSDRVKDFLKSIDYRNPGIYFLSDSSNEGSREILIAVSFVLSKGLEKAIDDEIKKSPFDPRFDMFLELDLEASSPDVSTFTCERDFQRYTDWLKTRVLLNSREISELQNRNDQLVHKIRNFPSYNEGCSVNEILALNSEKYAGIFMDQTDRISKILMNHQEWSKNECVYWQWMVGWSGN
ncbi:uncharacterized protein LOC123308686 isoform X2 [Coccinella septempunctata]|uniref:uncharacterized protein LOC123308686 isoform X2 n=1 Tax=Coccinella septempunctata TaxID=41139 RepID=UPI001D095343|nr:uncharacterized protein LOC123308686 isoform X2 [Coccinella septempunctata]